ncbi:phosphoethanolamine transferase [Pseudomonas syringae]|uniref:Phosphoethanolamine--lipid A transferase n=1 Tax=Pseudomonas syringae Cit 7 TaxID=629264 RepID=A0A8T8M1B7_PSESX|nr:phosphoethanolamine--lipid A transferase [Pseudomonas syringae]MBC9741754.1 phosphoethanolamine--lipid A transferase [Pseudomonas syringae pv. syringae]MBC9745878.1 phosphoethanolamine--lipid A transferase [Pseudomonas syringae pv. syringae]MCK9721349.1 phosphoethanolamine--lipid A transferase [Pseudomonas syringae pv. syringae]MCK9775210.1 phosphoethanolamine--lipid A transferase [Pseudomonas syringae pv. syringae]MDU8574800.1 phosphoethanolamine--lipid A transferase [Pseudomonas syringae]
MPTPRTVRPEVVTLLASAFLLLGFNINLWQHLFSITSADSKGLAMRFAFGLMIFCVFNIVLTLLAFRRVLKPVLISLFMISAGVVYFMTEYGVMIDAGMFRNFAETNVTEVQGLLSLKLALYILLLGIVPSLILWKLPISYRRWHLELFSKLLVTVACCVAIGAVALANYQGLSSLFRNHHELRLMVVPSNYIGASLGYLSEQVISARRPFVKIGEDAKRSADWATHARKSLTVLVVGESARAENFGILGYGRNTTPNLNKESGLVAFTDVYSCGTETAVSVPCMFSNMGRKNYNATQARNQEGLLDVLKRAGIDVIWRDNQAGCKGTCDRVTFQDVSNLKDPLLCNNHECRDEILLQNLQAFIDGLDKDTVLVLHQMGSHGPEYYKRYPKDFETFTPVCESNALNNCSRDSIVNGYDNTLLYTDHVLSTLIDLLRTNQNKVDTAMVYLSDHGESLGEYNLFLHGTPYVLAPDQQKHVPMMVWLSDTYQKSFAVTPECLAKQRNAPLSQDNLFHSMLGLLKVDTKVYDPSLDMFAACRSELATTDK